MSPTSRHDAEHLLDDEAPAGFSWNDYVAHLVVQHGSLSALAQKLAALAQGPEDPMSIERALRRLRRRGNLDGGEHGRRLLRMFGLPASIEARLQWMGVYHSRFADLPLPVCLDQLRSWDRPPVSDSRARVWIELGLASAALRTKDLETAAAHARRARSGAQDGLAGIELGLVEAFLANEQGDRERVRQRLEDVGRRLGQGDLPPPERACLHARWVDQCAYQKTHPPAGEEPDFEGALTLYQSIPPGDVHPFVSYRRDAGLAYARWKLGDPDGALGLAESACRHAGDGGYVRLRAMGLNLIARILGEEAGAPYRARARAIAERLADEDLLGRIVRRPRPRS
jgi:hypothetical protein